jgi:hypothetical protein
MVAVPGVAAVARVHVVAGVHVMLAVLGVTRVLRVTPVLGVTFVAFVAGVVHLAVAGVTHFPGVAGMLVTTTTCRGVIMMLGCRGRTRGCGRIARVVLMLVGHATKIYPRVVSVKPEPGGGDLAAQPYVTRRYRFRRNGVRPRGFTTESRVVRARTAQAAAESTTSCSFIASNPLPIPPMAA